MKTNKVSTMRKFAMRRAARKHKVLDSSHGAKRRPTASISRYSKGKEAFVLKITPPSSSTGVPYKTKIIKAPLKLIILPTEETVVPSVDTADTESKRVSKEDDTAEDDEGKSSGSNEDDSLPHGEPRVTGVTEGSTRHGGTSTIPHHNMAVHPDMQSASSGVRWKMVYDHTKLDDSKEGKRYKKKRKQSHSRTEDPTEDPADSGSPAIVAGIFAGILMLLFIFTGVPRLW